MLIDPGDIRTWLYTSEFKDSASKDEIFSSMEQFQAHNKSLNLSGFLITNGKSIMQLLEGKDNVVNVLREKIIADDRHVNVVNEVWELEEERAYPEWSMRKMRASNYEILFKEIQSAKMATIATNIARMLFDTTFEK